KPAHRPGGRGVDHRLLGQRHRRRASDQLGLHLGRRPLRPGRRRRHDRRDDRHLPPLDRFGAV
ncbi:MAG: hypothetical protein AVDCRST_MAG70-178, partial [uncultured Thermomicrobiales bacterium]